VRRNPRPYRNHDCAWLFCPLSGYSGHPFGLAGCLQSTHNGLTFGVVIPVHDALRSGIFRDRSGASIVRRRTFISGIGVAAAWPILAHAQRSSAMRRIAEVGALAPACRTLFRFEDFCSNSAPFTEVATT